MNLKDLEKLILLKSKVFESVQKVCRKLLLLHPLAEPVRQYLDKRISKTTQEKFGFGYFPDNEHLDLLLENIPEHILEQVKLVYRQPLQDGSHRVEILRGSLSKHNLIIPYYDVYGGIKSLVGRTILPDEKRKEIEIPKYKNTRFNKSLHLFGLNQAKHSIIEKNNVILVEGQFDCIACHEHGIKNVVALGGVFLSKYQSQLLLRYTDNILLLLDNDIKGQKGAEKIIKKYSKFANIKNLDIIKHHKDIDEFLRSGYQFKFQEING